jgi:predicted DNA-binding ribbon-helix-helix protein
MIGADRDGELSMQSRVVKRSIMIGGHRTSVSLEQPFWQGLKDIAAMQGMSVSNLVATIHGGRHRGNLSSSLRMFVLDHYRTRLCSDCARRLATMGGSSQIGEDSS